MSNDPSPGVPIRNLAVATDFSPWSDRATQHALAVAYRFGAVLHFVHTVRRSEFSFVPGMMVQLDDLAQRDCAHMISRLKADHCLDDIEHHCWNMEGEVPAVFGDLVRDHKIDLLILGTRGRSAISKLLLGSIAEEILHCVSCPVLTVGPWSRGATRQLQMKRVLFATDLSAESFDAIPHLLTVATTWQTEIDVLHVCSSATSNHRDSMEAVERGMDCLAGTAPSLSIRYQLLRGEPSSTVLNFARQNRIDLIVLGLEAHRSMYGGPPLSHAYEIVRQAECPVLSVRPVRRPTIVKR
jgi:nucleotide-binding universal stress UspA family protein